MRGFSVTFETVTPESAAEGDAAERGFLGQDMTFREAFTLFQEERDWTYAEPDCLPISREQPPSWFIDYGEQDYGGNTRSVSLHLPERITGSSAMRIARLIGCYGAK